MVVLLLLVLVANSSLELLLAMSVQQTTTVKKDYLPCLVLLGMFHPLAKILATRVLLEPMKTIINAKPVLEDISVLHQ